MKRVVTAVRAMWSDPGRRHTLLLALILAAGLVLRLWLWARPDHPLANDETEYLPVALDLAHGRGFVFYNTYRWLRAPLYPLFLAFFLAISGDNARVATLAQALLSTATIYLFYRLGRKLFPNQERAGLAAVLLAALLLPFATFPALFMAETLFTFLLAAFFLAVLRVPEEAPGRRWRWTAASGVLLGLAALTRAVGLAFLPVAAGWLFFALQPPDSGWSISGLGRRIGSRRPEAGGRKPGAHPFNGGRGRASCILIPALLIFSGVLTIAPWTIRNAFAYHRFIPLDTGASYSLWAFYEPHEDIDEINRQLEAIPNPADRQAYAMRKGLERIREDPGVVWRKLLSTFPYLLRVKPIEDRFLLYPYREPALPYLVLSLLLDDGLYLLITAAALLALLLTRGSRGKTMLLFWLLYNVAVVLVLHAEARYRQIFFPALIPFAGLALAHGKDLWQQAPRRKLSLVLWLLLLTGLGYCFVHYSPWKWMGQNLQRGWRQAVAAVDWQLGRPEAALAAYEWAQAVDEKDPEPVYDHALALERLGRTDDARREYRRCWNLRVNYLPCSTALGNRLRQDGRDDEARTAFAGRYVAEDDVLAWAWRNLLLPPRDRLDVGDGLDVGYVDHLYAGESAGGLTYRWTRARSSVRLIPTTDGAVPLRLRLAAPRLGDAPPVTVIATVGGKRVGQWQVGRSWETFETAPVRVHAGRPVDFVLYSDTFTPQAIDPTLADTRELGVQLDWAELGPW